MKSKTETIRKMVSYLNDEDKDELNRSGYNFTRDFILKTCITLLGKGARYEVNKFRDGM
jgi:hypothetical protein